MIMQFAAIYLDGRQQVFRLEKDQFTLGRSSKCDIVLNEEGFSRQHCLIEVIDGDVFVTDLGSANGVLINEEKIPPHQRVKFNLSFSLNMAGVEISDFQFLNDQYHEEEAHKVIEMTRPTSQSLSSSVLKNKSSTSKGFKAEKRSNSKSMHPGLRGVFIILVVLVILTTYHQFFKESESEDEAISKMLYESYTSKKKADGSIKTRNF